MIELAPHQTEAIDRIGILLDRFRGAVLADEVGLGKSFVAAAIAASFGGEIEVIVPASLVTQWRGTLENFGADAEVITHDSLIGDRFVPRVLEDNAANTDLPPFFAQHVTTPHSVVTAHLIDQAGQPTIAARDEILSFFASRLAS